MVAAVRVVEAKAVARAAAARAEGLEEARAVAARAVAEWAARPVAVAGKGRPRHTRRQQSLAYRVHERLL